MVETTELVAPILCLCVCVLSKMLTLCQPSGVSWLVQPLNCEVVIRNFLTWQVLFQASVNLFHCVASDRHFRAATTKSVYFLTFCHSQQNIHQAKITHKEIRQIKGEQNSVLEEGLIACQWNKYDSGQWTSPRTNLIMYQHVNTEALYTLGLHNLAMTKTPLYTTFIQ